jgi:5-oxoprolinase (ATP-hydrolysing)
VLNAPYDGGTHLPDVTVVMPVFADDSVAAPAWFVAARGHHGRRRRDQPPARLPPTSRSLDEEGVLLDNVLLVDKGRFCEAELRALLGAGRWQARNPDQNVADLKAQLAACARGAAELRRGRRRAEPHCGRRLYEPRAGARRSGGARLESTAHVDGQFRVPMDNGAEIAVAVSIDRAARTATIDFTGSSPQLADNFNAPLPVVRAAVLYVVRTLIDGPVPMNEGCLRPLTIVVPEHSMLRPQAPAAVVAGNVETSQVLCDALFGALGAMAASQGTMNNFTFGDDRHQYYRTIAGGAGAGPDFAGASVVPNAYDQQPPYRSRSAGGEIPWCWREFSIRPRLRRRGRTSAAATARCAAYASSSRWRRGILSNRRRTAPFGLAGGGDGARGVNRIERADGSIEELGSTASAQMQPGDVFVMRRRAAPATARRSALQSPPTRDDA